MKRVEFGSAEHDRSIELRRSVLRQPLGLDFTKEELEDEKGETVLCAFLKETLVATLNLVNLHSPKAMKMRQVAVSTEVQGKGIGRALVEASEELARGEGAEYMKLHARDAAVPFYIALGYETEGEPFQEVGIQHRQMKKNLLLL